MYKITGSEETINILGVRHYEEHKPADWNSEYVTQTSFKATEDNGVFYFVCDENMIPRLNDQEEFSTLLKEDFILE